MPTTTEAVTVVIPVHDAAERLEAVVPAWGNVLEKTGREYEILIVVDGGAEAVREAAAKLKGRVRRLRVLSHDERRGFGACLKSALAETHTPLFFYTALDYPYTPSDIRTLLERIDLRDEILHKQPDMISGCRTGIPAPGAVTWFRRTWKMFWRIFAGLPITEANPWHGWPAVLYRWRVGWIYGVPLVDVSSCFKLFRTSFLKSVPIQSNGDFVHTELVAKATFLTSVMDEVPLTPKPDSIPPLGSTAADQRRVFHTPEFAFRPSPPVGSTPPEPAGAPQPVPAPAPGESAPAITSPPAS